MARRVQFLSSILLLTSLFGCRDDNRIVNADRAMVTTSHGITRVDGMAFTGTLVVTDPQSGDTISRSRFRDGLEDGRWERFYRRGVLAETRDYDHGRKAGMFQAWWPNGVLRSEYYFKDGEYDGPSRDWSDNGILVRHMNYRKGYENGRQQLWDDDGTLRANYVARNGRNYGLTGVKGCATIWEKDSVRTH